MSEHDEALDSPLLNELADCAPDWFDTLNDEPPSEEVLALLGLPPGTEVTMEHVGAFLAFGRLQRGRGRCATGIGRHYERLTANARKVRALSAYEMRLKHHSFGQIADALGVSRSTACRLVRQGMAVVFPSAAQLAKERADRMTKRGRGRPRKDDALVPDRVLYKCYQMAKCINAGKCLDGNPIAWGRPEMPCSREVVKSWRLREVRAHQGP